MIQIPHTGAGALQKFHGTAGIAASNLFHTRVV